MRGCNLIVKWKYIKEKAREFLQLFAEVDARSDHTFVSDEIYRIASKIKAMDDTAIDDLQQRFKSIGSISLFEFLSHILPSLYTALYGKCDLKSSTDIYTQSRRRKKKKTRCGRLTTNEIFDDISICPRRSDFIKKLMRVLVEESTQQISLVKCENESSDEDDIEQDRMDLDSVDENMSPPSSREKLPELVRCMHTILTFYENVRVDRNNSTSNHGMLQTLKLPFAVSL